MTFEDHAEVRNAWKISWSKYKIVTAHGQSTLQLNPNSSRLRMALITGPEFDRQVSTEAKVCPACRNPAAEPVGRGSLLAAPQPAPCI